MMSCLIDAINGNAALPHLAPPFWQCWSWLRFSVARGVPGRRQSFLEPGTSKLVSLPIWRTSSNSLYNTITCNVSFKGKPFYTSWSVQEGRKIAIICIFTHFKEYFYLSYKVELSSSSQDMILQHEAVDQESYLRVLQNWCFLNNIKIKTFVSLFFLNVY